MSRFSSIMKKESTINLSHSTSQYAFINTIGLYVLCSLLIVQPFHFVVTDKLPYYREYFAVIFSLLFIHKLFNYKFGLSMRPEIFFMFLFLFALIFYALLDPGANLYESDYTDEVSEKILDVNLTLYVLRNALLYIPMVCYMALRGLSEKEIKLIAGIVALVAPFSIVVFLYNIGFFPSYNIMDIVSLGGNYLQWNSYVPYLTFPFIASLYLVVELRHRLFKLLFLSILLFIFLYIFVSASRQSLLYCVLMALLFIMYIPTKMKVPVLLIAISLIILIYVMINYTLSNYIINDNLLDRYMSAAGYVETRRLEIMRDGLVLLDVPEYLVGAGLSSVIISGPHNDYIRWTQRIGIPGMVLSFLPFFLSLKNIFRFTKRKKTSPMLILFIFSALFFSIYHSFFGYPREDAYQALYAFLGLGLWLAISKSEPILE